jgi:hypothetical protein
MKSMTLLEAKTASFKNNSLTKEQRQRFNRSKRPFKIKSAKVTFLVERDS